MGRPILPSLSLPLSPTPITIKEATLSHYDTRHWSYTLPTTFPLFFSPPCSCSLLFLLFVLFSNGNYISSFEFQLLDLDNSRGWAYLLIGVSILSWELLVPLKTNLYGEAQFCEEWRAEIASWFSVPSHGRRACSSVLEAQGLLMPFACFHHPWGRSLQGWSLGFARLVFFFFLFSVSILNSTLVSNLTSLEWDKLQCHEN